MKNRIVCLAVMLGLAGAARAAEEGPVFPKEARVLFQGDSITDGNRGRSADPNHILGHGYQFIIAAKYAGTFPERGLTFMNRGVSGNKVTDLAKRWAKDTIELRPTIVSILIGVNDASAAIGKSKEATTIEQFEEVYGKLIEDTQAALPGVRVVLCEPFVLPVGGVKAKWEEWQAEVKRRQAVVERLAAKYKTPYVRFQKMFDEALKRAPADYWIWDGVHPTYAGHQLMADEWVRTVDAAWHVRAAGATPTIKEEAMVPPYTLPDPLVCVDGTRVTDAKVWRERRRPELMKMFENEMYGRTPIGRPAELKFVVREEKKGARGGKATRLRVGVLFEGKEEGRQMELLIYLPADAKGPVPIFFGYNFDGNYTTTAEGDIPLPRRLADGQVEKTPAEASRGKQASLWDYDNALAHGYGVATAGYKEVEPDADGHWRDGPRGLAAEPGAGEWGECGAWAWGMSRAMDYFETEPRINAKRVAAIGFSRIGKATLWAGAQDERFAIVMSNCSGGGGAALSKRIFGETVENLTGGPARWFCANFRKYAGREADLPMDQHELIALIAPRPVLITSAAEDLWSDPKGEFLSGAGADPVYRLLGTDGIAQREWPAVGTLLKGRIGYFMRAGKHDVTAEDWRAMIEFADAHFRGK